MSFIELKLKGGDLYNYNYTKCEYRCSLGLQLAWIQSLGVLGPALGAEPFALRRHHDADTLKVEPLDETIVAIACNHLGYLVVGTAAIAVHGFTLSRQTGTCWRPDRIPYVVRLEVLQRGKVRIGEQSWRNGLIKRFRCRWRWQRWWRRRLHYCCCCC